MPRIITRNSLNIIISNLVSTTYTLSISALPSAITATFHVGPNIPSIGLHWHKTHTEYIYIRQGSALITIGDRTAVFTKDDGVNPIPRYTIHEIQRADDMEEGNHAKDELCFGDGLIMQIG